MPRVEGGCLCGKVRYSSDSEPGITAICHCTNCQKQSGTAFSIVVGVAADSLTVNGDSLRTFHDRGDSGQPVLRNFCSNCGSPIFSEVMADPGVLYVKAGTLDDTSWLQPQLHIYCDSAHSWLMIDDDLPRVAREFVPDTA